ncbi:MAG: fimbrillin family protein [Rikenellaceae bacterium]|nr:fimbrillin family protein [Rikenellaceae bacterium]
MKFKTIAAAGAVAVAALTGCSVNDPISEAQKARAVQFTAGIDKATTVQPTRAADTDWAAGDAVGIFMVEHGTTNIVDGAGNKEYVTTSGDGAFTAASALDEMYYPSGSVDFIAYYPYAASATLGNINVKIGDQKNQPTFDLLYSDAKNKSKSETPVNLIFDHQLSKLVMNVKAGEGLSDGDLTGMTVTIKGMNTQTTFDLSTGALGAPGTPAEIIPRTLTDGIKYDAIILPSAAISEGDYSVDFTINPNTADNETFTWNMAAGTDFAAGNEYTYAVTLSRTEVTATGEITPWNTSGNDRGDVTAE